MTTVSVPEVVLEKAMQVAAGRSREQVVVEALMEYTQRHDQACLIKYLGTSDGFMSPQELQAMRETCA